jgi:hypothetical protein
METLQRTANRGSISTGYDIDNSLKFEADNSEKLSRSQTTGTNRKKFTVSFWVKRSELGALQVLASAEVSGNDLSFLDFETDDVLRFRDTASASDQCILETNRVFRDTSAWYHIVLRVDTTDGTADDLTFGNNGYYLDFEDSSNLGNDASGGTDFTLNNITSADQATDTPTNNFAVLNTISATSTDLHATEGATFLSNDDGSISWLTISATIGVTSGKWYWENQKNSNTGNFFSGIAASDDPALRTANLLGATSEGSSIAFQYSNNSIANGSGSFTMVSGEIMMFALDMDNGALYFGKQGTWQNSSDPTSGASKTGASTLWSSFDDKIVLPALQAFQNNQIFTNFGGYSSYAISTPASDASGYGTFEYAPPTGYYALCTKNLAEFG